MKTKFFVLLILLTTLIVVTGCKDNDSKEKVKPAKTPKEQIVISNGVKTKLPFSPTDEKLSKYVDWYKVVPLVNGDILVNVNNYIVLTEKNRNDHIKTKFSLPLKEHGYVMYKVC